MNYRSLALRSLVALVCMFISAVPLHAQYVYKIKADTVRIYNTCDTAELVLQNRTQNVAGFLYNKGQGVTEFRPLSDSFILNQNSSKQTANFSISGSGAVDGSLNAGTWMVAKAGFYADRNTVSSGTVGYALRDATSRMRWGIGTQTLETSGDVGSDFSIFRYHDDGSNISASDFVIRRLNGNVGIHNVLPSNTLDVNGTGFFSGNLSSNGILTVNGGTINMTNPSINMVMFPGNNVNSSPVHGASRSTGTKVVLFPSFSTLNTDYAIGVEDSNMWFSVPSNKIGFKFYANDTAVSKIDGKGNGEWLGRGRFGGSSSSNQVIGAGPAAEVHYVNGSALFQGYDRTAGAYLPAMITGGVGNITKSLVLNNTGYQFLNLPNAGLLGTDANGYLQDVSASIALANVLSHGNRANYNINLGATGNTDLFTFGTTRKYLDTSYITTYGIFNALGTAGAYIASGNGTGYNSKLVYLPFSGDAPMYSPNGGNNYYTVWHAANHPQGQQFTPNLTGANVLATFTTNAAGHVNGLTTRTLTPADIGAAPSADYVSRTADTIDPQQANVYVKDLNKVANTAIFHANNSATNAPPAGLPGYVFSLGNADIQSPEKGQMILSYNIDDGFFYRMGSNTSWNSWYRVASRTWSSANLIQNQTTTTQTGSFKISGPGTGQLFIAVGGDTSGTNSGIFYSLRTATNKNRWQIGISDAETGSNAGGNFNIYRHKDDGSYLSSAFFISRNNGNVGIGTITPGSKLDVAGDIHASGAITAPSITQTSLRSLKKDIRPFTASALNILDSAQVRTFIFKADTTNTTRIGFIADEVPDAMAATGRRGVEETNTVALLVKAIQEMKAEMDAMKAKVSQVDALQRRVHDLEVQLKEKNK